MEKISNQDLIKKLLNKDGVAFELLYDQYAPALYGYILQNESDPSKANDILCTAFKEIKKHISEYDAQKTTLFVWMFRMVKKELGFTTYPILLSDDKVKNSAIKIVA